MKLILIEGLSPIPPFYASYLRSELLPKLKTVPYTAYGWNQQMGIPVDDYVIVTHSFGWMEVRDAIAANAFKTLPPKAIIAVDPRSWWGDFGEKFQAPKNIPTYCFYQKSWFSLPGYPINGATNVQITGYGHTAMPGAPQVVRKVGELL